MSALAHSGVDSVVLRDTSHRAARSAREQADWLAWLELGGSAPRTLDAYERTTAVLMKAYPDKEFGEFTDGDLMAVLMKFPAPSRRIRKAHLSSWFGWGYRTRRIPANPVDLLPKINQKNQPIIDVFTEREEEALMALPSPDGHLMALLLLSGIRKAEAIHMQGRRINFDAGIVMVKEGAKGSKDRVVPMIPRLREAMANMFLLEGINDTSYLWYDKPGGAFARGVRRTKPIADSAFHRWWVRCLDQADVRYRKPHTTRHSFATRWRTMGLAIDDIQKMLGHSSVSTTSDLYVHTSAVEVGARMFSLLGLVEDED